MTSLEAASAEAFAMEAELIALRKDHSSLKSQFDILERSYVSIKPKADLYFKEN